jgi:hypothetical protein
MTAHLVVKMGRGLSARKRRLSRELNWLVRAFQIQPGRATYGPEPDGWARTKQRGGTVRIPSYMHRTTSAGRRKMGRKSKMGRKTGAPSPRRMVSGAHPGRARARLGSGRGPAEARAGAATSYAHCGGAGGGPGPADIEINLKGPAAGPSVMNRRRSGQRSCTEMWSPLSDYWHRHSLPGRVAPQCPHSDWSRGGVGGCVAQRAVIALAVT